MEYGQIKRMVKDRGFGFLRIDGKAGDYFFHKDDCVDDFNDMKENDKITCRIGKSPKGPRAVEVRLG